jgi:hypothetical protein
MLGSVCGVSSHSVSRYAVTNVIAPLAVQGDDLSRRKNVTVKRK